MNKLLLVVPSRGRPENIARLYQALEETCDEQTDLIVGLDEDDPARDQYPDGIEYVIRADLHGVVPWMNELALSRVNDYNYIGMIGDDNVPRTTGWDSQIISALQKTPFAFGNDLYPREPGSHCAHIFCRSEIIKTLGYLGPPQLRHMFVDNSWLEWGKACGITYLHDVIIEHLHFTTGKASYDKTYEAAVDRWDSDKASWDAYQSGKLQEDIDRIRGVL